MRLDHGTGRDGGAGGFGGSPSGMYNGMPMICFSQPLGITAWLRLAPWANTRKGCRTIAAAGLLAQQAFKGAACGLFILIGCQLHASALH
jgi:hypothetical protein